MSFKKVSVLVGLVSLIAFGAASQSEAKRHLFEKEERQALKAKLGKGGMKKAKMEARAKCNKLPTQPERLKCKQDYIRGVASGRS